MTDVGLDEDNSISPNTSASGITFAFCVFPPLAYVPKLNVEKTNAIVNKANNNLEAFLPKLKTSPLNKF
ncbi:hypothetical protein [Bacillus sp. LL01]|uniref:hypothetical protein n=1 Tax=Bacillus sp. LL01 TaxID=1665556 RepID=UPI001F51CA0B